MSSSITHLNKLRVGLGAVKLHSNVKKITLTFPVRNGYSPGARYFYKDYLPRLKFNNPDVEFKVDKYSEKVEANVEVGFEDGTNKKLKIAKLTSHDLCYQLLELTLPKDKPL